LAGEGRRCGAVQWALGSGSLALSLSAAGGVAAPTTERAERNREGFPPAQVGGRFGRWGWAETEAQWPTPHPHRTRHGNGVGWDCGAQQQHAPEHACGQTSLTLAAHRSPLDSAGRRLMSSSWCLVSGVWCLVSAGAACSVAATAVLFYSTRISGAVPCCLTFY